LLIYLKGAGRPTPLRFKAKQEAQPDLPSLFLKRFVRPEGMPAEARLFQTS